MNNALQLAIAVATLVTLVFGMIGVAVRLILVPYLRTSLIEPVRQINHQVSVNGNTSDSPTVLDKLHEVQDNVSEKLHDVQMEVREAKFETLVLSRMFDGHLTWSQDEVDRMTERIIAVERRTNDER